MLHLLIAAFTEAQASDDDGREREGKGRTKRFKM